MGMYNEVFKSCPECGTRCEIQIGQVVLGFGGFELDNPSHFSFDDLTQSQKQDLAEYVSEKTFHCENCSHSFQVDVQVDRSKGTRVVI